MIKKRRIIIAKMLIIWVVFFIIDFFLAKLNKSPIFSIPISMHKDGGSTEYYGLGYKVIKYVNLTGNNVAEAEIEKVDFGTWFMSLSQPKH